MSGIIEQVSAGNFDGYKSGANFYATAGAAFLGNGGTEQSGFFYFSDVQIPAGAEILSAILQFRAFDSRSTNTVNLNIHFEAADNPSPPTTAADYNGRSVGDAVAWNAISGWTVGSWYDSPDLTEELQAVINRPGWAAGNTVGVLAKDNGSTYNRVCSTYEGDPSYAVKLVVTFITDETISEETGAGDTADGYSLTDSISDQSGLADAIDALDFGGAFSDGAGAGDAVSLTFEGSGVEADAAGLGDAVSIEIDAALADAGGLGDSADAFNWTEWIATNLDRAVARYYCTITGAADGEADLEVPISSFQARKQTGSDTYVSVVIPGVAYADSIADRANGEIVVEMAYLIDGAESLREEILRADLEQINIYYSASSRSIVLIGHKEQTFVAKDNPLFDPIYSARVDGRLSWRFAVPDLYLNPGDTARVGDDEITVDAVIYIVAAGGGQTNMEVQE